MSESTNTWGPRGRAFAFRYAWTQFWRTLFGSVTTYSRWCTLWGKQRPGYGHIVTPLWVWLVWAAVGAPLFAAEQAYAYLWLDAGWPGRWQERIGNAHLAVANWVERRTQYFAWLPADSGDPHEVGLHFRSDLLTVERDADGVRHYPNRPRIYVRSFSGGGTTTIDSEGRYV